MIAHILLRCGLEPAYLIGGALRTTGRNADWGAGEWLVVEADESDRSMLSLHVEIAVVTNVELDHHATFASLAELRDAFRGSWPARRRRCCGTAPTCSPCAATRPHVAFDAVDAAARAGRLALRLARPRGAPAVPGEHNARNAHAALEACRLAGADPAAAAAALADFAGAGRRFERLGATPAGARGRRRLRPPPDRGRGDDRRRPHAAPAPPRRRLPAASVLAHRAPGARLRRPRWRAPTSPPCSTSTRRASAPRTSPA